MNYEFFMQKCLELAVLSEGQVSPNPLVGCVIVDDNGEIIAQGRHEKYGEPHAEANALKSAGKRAKGATLFVNLEPCNHYGKNPPCSKAIIEAGIKKVVIGANDTSEKASGGASALRNAGIEVIENVFEKECKKINEIFFFSLTHKRPFIALKTATTLDGKIAAADGSSKWITAENARAQVQCLRNKYDAILTTAKTVQIDNPSLTCRMDGGRNPIRIVIDKYSILDNSYKVFNNDARVIWQKDEFNEEFAHYLYSQNIRSILVEAGGNFAGSLLKQNLVDKIYHFIAPKIIGNNEATSFVNGLDITNINNSQKFEIVSTKFLSPDILLEIYPKL